MLIFWWENPIRKAILVGWIPFSILFRWGCRLALGINESLIGSKRQDPKGWLLDPANSMTLLSGQCDSRIETPHVITKETCGRTCSLSVRQKSSRESVGFSHDLPD
jgi:hypothetical protein